MTDEQTVWTLVASGGRETRGTLERLLNTDGSRWWSAGMIAPWNTRVTHTLPDGGVADTDWGIISNSERSIRWRNESGKLAFVMVSLTDPKCEGTKELVSVAMSCNEYLVDDRYRAGTRVSWIREIQYEATGGPWIRYEMLAEGSG